MATSAARQKKSTTKTTSRQTVKSKAKKPSRWNTFFTRRYAKPAAFVLLFALIGGGTVWWASAATTTYSLWSNSTVPKTITANDPKSVELGVKFHAKVAGYITGVRFYKGAQNTGTHTGNLWDTKGNLLAQATFTNESSNGWQSVTFPHPVSIAANTTYIASYFAPKGHYSANNYYFLNMRAHNNLVAPNSTSSSPNGVYLYSSRSGFPTQTYQATNYWVDVMFNTKLISPQPAPAAPTGLNATFNGTAVALTWQASAGANPVKSYNVYRDGNKIGTTTTAIYSDDSIVFNKTYSYQVQAVDMTDATSALSAAVSITIPADNTPTPPVNPVPPVQPQGSWPTADNTGRAAGPLPVVTGDVTLDTPNQVYQNEQVNGTISVTACNVTIKNVEVLAGENYTGDSTPDLFAIWAKQPENCALTIDHVTVITNAFANPTNQGNLSYMTNAVRSAYGGPLTITNSNFRGMQIGVVGIGTGLVQGNYMELGPNQRGDHNEDLEIYGGNNLTVNDNTMLNSNQQTAVIACFTDFGSNNNMTFSNNLMAGGGYTVYACGGLTDDQGNPSPPKNVSFISNVFWKKYFSNVGYYGEGRDFASSGGDQWAGNVYMNADGTLTTQTVSQPGPAS